MLCAEYPFCSNQFRDQITSTKVFDSTFQLFLRVFLLDDVLEGRRKKAASGQFKFQFDDDLLYNADDDNGYGDDEVDDDGDGGGGDYDDSIQGIQGGGLWSI